MSFKKKVIDIQNSNNSIFNIDKLIEECLELALVLKQRQTRTAGKKPLRSEVVSEIADVNRLLWWAEDDFGRGTEVKDNIRAKANRIAQKNLIKIKIK